MNDLKFFIELTTCLLITEQGHSGGSSWMNLCSIIHTDYQTWPCATESTKAEYLYC